MTQRLVLLADDDPDLAESLLLLLETEGYRAALARDGAEALALIDELHPDAVLLDVMMPRVDGLTVLRELQGRAWRPAVVAISAYPEHLRTAALAGAVHVLAKPFSIRDLRDALIDALTPVPPPA